MSEAKPMPSAKTVRAGVFGVFGVLMLAILSMLSNAIPSQIRAPSLMHMAFGSGMCSLLGWMSLAAMFTTVIILSIWARSEPRMRIHGDFWRGLLTCQFMTFLLLSSLFYLMQPCSALAMGPIEKDRIFIAQCVGALGALFFQSLCSLIMVSLISLSEDSGKGPDRLNPAPFLCAINLVLLIAGLVTTVVGSPLNMILMS